MSEFIERPRYACALGGALSTLRAIPKAIPIIHAASGCGYNLFNATNAGSAYLGGGYCGSTSIPSSNVTEKEIVFGGEQRLEEEIQTTLEIMDGDLFVVLSGCMVEMIGDDIDSVVRRFDESHKVIAISTPSFKGNSYYGYDLLLEGFVKYYINKPKIKAEKKVNILGIVPGEDVFWKGNLKEIKRIFSLLGIEANTLFGEGEGLNDIQSSSEASYNIVLSEVYGHLAAQAYEEKFGIPYVVEQLPIGYLQTEKFLREIGVLFGISEEEVNQALSLDREIYYDYFERFSDIYTDADLQNYAVVVGDANYAPSVTRFLSDELGWLPKLSVITDILNDKQKTSLQRSYENFESGLTVPVKFDTNTSSVKKYLREVWEPYKNEKHYDSLTPLVIVGSILEKELATSLNAPLITVTYPITNRVVLNRTYIGFNGGLALTEDILSTLVAGR